MQSFFGKFKLGQGVLRYRMIYQAEVCQNFVMDDLSCLRLHALEKTIKASKLRIARYYDYKVKVKQFSEGDLV